ncbi:hypothetical protein AY599_11880 [Leptolyngbya valderiana BDU 20041]|nr:hypothetical protein AY599_11880 [Leptolyngbya valderiana BDU 20041]
MLDVSTSLSGSTERSAIADLMKKREFKTIVGQALRYQDSLYSSFSTSFSYDDDRELKPDRDGRNSKLLLRDLWAF